MSAGLFIRRVIVNWPPDWTHLPRTCKRLKPVEARKTFSLLRRSDDITAKTRFIRRRWRQQRLQRPPCFRRILATPGRAKSPPSSPSLARPSPAAGSKPRLPSGFGRIRFVGLLVQFPQQRQRRPVGRVGGLPPGSRPRRTEPSPSVLLRRPARGRRPEVRAVPAWAAVLSFESNDAGISCLTPNSIHCSPCGFHLGLPLFFTVTLSLARFKFGKLLQPVKSMKLNAIKS